MKYLFQLCVIFTISFIGELLNILVPLPIPASVYGLIILLLLLIFKIIKVENIKDTSQFLVSNMAVMFIGPAASIITVWPLFKQKLIPYMLIILISTIVVMIVSGVLTQKVLEKGENK